MVSVGKESSFVYTEKYQTEMNLTLDTHKIIEPN